MLNTAKLKSGLVNLFSVYNTSHITVAQTLSNEIVSYWATGTHAATGTPVISTPALSVLFSKLSLAYAPGNKTVTIFSKDLIDAIDTGFKTITLIGPQFGTGGLSFANTAILQTKLNTALAFPPSGAQHGSLLADAIDSYTKTNVIYGSGVPTTYPPIVGDSFT